MKPVSRQTELFGIVDLIKVGNLLSESIVHSIKVEGISYYPSAMDKNNRNKNYIQIIEK
jgi:hypothetical protein